MPHTHINSHSHSEIWKVIGACMRPVLLYGGRGDGAAHGSQAPPVGEGGVATAAAARAKIAAAHARDLRMRGRAKIMGAGGRDSLERSLSARVILFRVRG